MQAKDDNTSTLNSTGTARIFLRGPTTDHDELIPDHSGLKDQLIGTILVQVDFCDSFKREDLLKYVIISVSI